MWLQLKHGKVGANEQQPMNSIQPWETLQCSETLRLKKNRHSRETCLASQAEVLTDTQVLHAVLQAPADDVCKHHTQYPVITQYHTQCHINIRYYACYDCASNQCRLWLHFTQPTIPATAVQPHVGPPRILKYSVVFLLLEYSKLYISDYYFHYQSSSPVVFSFCEVR